jgi:F0F1-type ATP synthase assembly protein I
MDRPFSGVASSTASVMIARTRSVYLPFYGVPCRGPDTVKKREALSLALNLSWTMLFSLLIPLLAGIWLDRRLGTAPLFILIGTVLGILAATVGVARMTLRTFSVAMGQDSDQQAEANGKEEPA